MFQPQEQYILAGRLVLQILSPDEMTLRKCYFQDRGAFMGFSGPAPMDLIQVCRETEEVIWSRDNLWYKFINDMKPAQFKEFMSAMMESVIVQTHPEKEEVNAD